MKYAKFFCDGIITLMAEIGANEILIDKVWELDTTLGKVLIILPEQEEIFSISMQFEEPERAKNKLPGLNNDLGKWDFSFSFSPPSEDGIEKMLLFIAGEIFKILKKKKS